jgi:hypothetical protein
MAKGSKVAGKAGVWRQDLKVRPKSLGFFCSLGMNQSTPKVIQQ